MEIKQEEEVQQPLTSTTDNTEDSLFDEKGYIKDPSKVTSGEMAKKLWEQGRMTTAQVKESKAHTLLKTKGKLELDAESAQILYNKGVLTDEDKESMNEYHNSPFTWYAKDTAKQIAGGVEDFFDNTVKTIGLLRSYDPTNLVNINAMLGDENFEGQRQKQLNKFSEFDTLGIKESDSEVGKAVRGITTFMAGFVPILGQVNKGVKIAQGGEALTALQGFKTSTLVGAGVDFAGFEGSTSNVSELIQNVPALQNPITEFLADKKDDPEIVKKLKNALDGAGVGAMFEGVFLALKATKGYFRTKVDDDAVGLNNLIEEATGVNPNPIRTTPTEETVKESVSEAPEVIKEVSPTEKALRESKLVKEAIESNGDIRFAIDSVVKEKNLATDNIEEISEQILKEQDELVEEADTLINKLTDDESFTKYIDESVRAEKEHIPPQTHEEIKANAEELGVNNIDVMLKTAEDTHDLAVRIHAIRKSVSDYADEIYTNIENFKATGRGTFEEELELFEQITNHGRMQKIAKGISANIGRALNAHKLKVGNKEVDIRLATPEELDDIALSMGGRNHIKKTIDDFYSTKNKGVKERNKFTRAIDKYSVADAFHGMWLSGLLSGLGTQGVNVIGNTSNLLLESIEHTIAVTGRSIATGEAKHLQEVTAKWSGMGHGVVEALRISKKDGEWQFGNVWKALGTNEPITDARLKLEDNVTHSMPSLFNDNLGETIELLKKEGKIKGTVHGALGVAGDVVTLPLRILSASDELFKTIIYRGEVYREAMERANKQANLSGAERSKFIQDIISEPSTDVHKLALEKARVGTFTEAIQPKNYIERNDLGTNLSKKMNLKEGGFADTNIKKLDGLQKGLTDIGMAGDKFAGMIMKGKQADKLGYPLKYVAPFITTPLDIVKYVGRRSPLAIFSKKFHADILAGGTRRAEALTRVATGGVLMTASYSLFEDGKVVGKVPKHLKEAYRNLGIPEYAIKVDNEWVQYNRLDPLGMFMGLVADVGTAIDYYENTDQDVEKMYAQVTLAFMNNLVNKTYMKGIQDVLNLIQDPERYKASDYAYNLLSSFIPYSSLVSQLNTSDDKYYRETNTKPVKSLSDFNENLREYVYKKVDPTKLEPKRDIFGEPINRMKRYGFAINHGEVTSDPVFREMFNAGANIGEMSERIEVKGHVYELSRKELNEIKQIMGELGAKESIRQLIESPRYQEIALDEVKASLIEARITKFRTKARKLWIARNPDVKDEFKDNIMKKRLQLFDGAEAKQANKKAHPIEALANIKGLTNKEEQ